MQTSLKEKLLAYITVNNPDLAVRLQEDYSMTAYLEDKVQSVLPSVKALITASKATYVIEELALNEMTADLRPSRFNYIKTVLEREFQASYEVFSEAGVLTYECINLLQHCSEIFETFGFNEENQEDRFLNYAVIAKMHDYLN